MSSRGGASAREEELLRRERELWARGYRHVAGVDEVGRGSLAGPVVAGAVVLHPGVRLTGVNDSKQVSPARREPLVELIRAQAVAVATGAASPREIDRLGIGRATFQAMERALRGLGIEPDFVLVDGRRIPFLPWPQEARPRADATMLAVAAASLVAKVTRDRLMARLGERYPSFGFAENKGYGTAAHVEALGRHGPCAWHRRSFAWGARGGVGDGAQEIASLSGAGDSRLAAGTRGIGNRGEEIAARYLAASGFRVIERNYRGAGAEIDLIAWDGPELVFVEVKYRRSDRRGDGPSAVTPAKQRLVSRAATAYLARLGWQGRRCRFDVVAISGGGGRSPAPRVDHYRNAFSGTSGSLW